MKIMFKVMVYNSTNIQQNNNHLSPQFTEDKKPTTYAVENSGLGLGQTQQMWRR
jgi:hypothetical protein